jgi:spore coat protein CotH
MGLVKTVGDKLDTKIKAGDLKESELIAEATEMMNKMKNMPGMGNIQSMLSKMGMGDLAGLGNLAGLGGKVNMGAMQANLDQKMKMAKTKERILAKAEANAKAKVAAQLLAQQKSAQPQQPQLSEEELLKLFSSGEKNEKTPRGAKPHPNKKKGKK